MTAAQDSRAQFEANIKALPNYFEGRLARTAHDDGYKVLDVHNQWIGWQASRAALSAEPVAWTTNKDRLLEALERAAKAETALRQLIDEAGNEMTPGWEERMSACIWRGNELLASAPKPAAQVRKPLTDAQCIEILKFGKSSVTMARAIERAHGITGECATAMQANRKARDDVRRDLETGSDSYGGSA